MTSSTGTEKNYFVDTGTVRYPVSFTHGDAKDVAAAIVESVPDGRIVVISDATVAALYQADLVAALQGMERSARGLTFSAGEASKRIETVSSLWAQIFEDDIDRGDCIVALGGGVTGDLAGFVAATVMRGIRFVQVPTTMLAMSDAAIGGKTGVNLPAGKNLAGAFYQPEAVICWVSTLQTLSERELISGMAEVVKSALIDGDDAVETLQSVAADALKKDPIALEAAARIGAGLKARIVSEDVLERGLRSLLNLGHTFGHAIEHAGGYGVWTHGEAVAAGMVLAAEFSVEVGEADSSVVDMVRATNAALGLPVEPPPMSVDEWLEPMFRDKKRDGDQVKLILCAGPGRCFGRLTDWDELRGFFERRRSAV